MVWPKIEKGAFIKKNNKALIILFLAAFLLRFISLDKFPMGFYIDEADVGYQAYSVLKTGADYKGHFLPIHFQSLADWRTPLYLYSTAGSIAFFGKSVFAIRASAAFFGTASVLIFYLLILEMFSKLKVKRRIAFLGALLLAVSPWHIQFSRQAFEVSLMLFMFLSGLLLFFKSFKSKKLLPFSLGLFLLVPYVYSTAKFFIPLFLIFLIFSFRSSIFPIKRKTLFPLFLVFIILGIPMAKEVLFGQGGERFKILSIFTDLETFGIVQHKRFLTTFAENIRFIDVLPFTISLVFFNKVVALSLVFLKNYFTSFSPQFLFFSGDPNLRHNASYMGVLYWIEAFIIPLGIFEFLKIKNSKTKFLIFAWALLAPIPAAITRDGATHATRLFFLLPPLLIFSSFGIEFLLNMKNKVFKKISLIFVSGGFLFCFSFFLFNYYFVYPYDSFYSWDFGKKELVEEAFKAKDEFESVEFMFPERELLQFILFFGNVDPSHFQRLGLKEDFKLSSRDPKSLLSKPQKGDISLCNVLFAGREEEIKTFLKTEKMPEYLSSYKVIKNPVGEIQYYLVYYNCSDGKN